MCLVKYFAFFSLRQAAINIIFVYLEFLNKALQLPFWVKFSHSQSPLGSYEIIAQQLWNEIYEILLPESYEIVAQELWNEIYEIVAQELWNEIYEIVTQQLWNEMARQIA